SPLHLAATAKQAAQRQVQLGGIAVDLDQAGEDLDGLILLLVEEVVEALQIPSRQPGGGCAAATGALPAAQQPAGQRSHRQQEPKQLQHQATSLSGSLRNSLSSFSRCASWRRN